MKMPIVKGRAPIDEVDMLSSTHINSGARFDGHFMEMPKEIGVYKYSVNVVPIPDWNGLTGNPGKSVIMPVVAFLSQFRTGFELMGV